MCDGCGFVDVVQALFAEVKPLLAEGGVMLVKGSRSMKMEMVVERLMDSK